MSDRVQLRRQRRAIVRSEVLAGGARDLDARREFNRRLAHMLQGGEQTMSATDLFATASETGGRRGADGFEDARESAFMASPTTSSWSRSNVEKPQRTLAEYESLFRQQGQKLGSGANGTVIALKGDNSMIMKIISIHDKDPKEKEANVQNAEREAMYTRLMGEKALGPILYASGRLNANEFGFVMERLNPLCAGKEDGLENDDPRADELSRMISRLADEGFVHIDLKCENIMETSAGELRFIDFDPDFFMSLDGITQPSQRTTRAGARDKKGAASLLMHILCSITVSRYSPWDKKRALFRRTIVGPLRRYWDALGLILQDEAEGWRPRLNNVCLRQSRESCTKDPHTDCIFRDPSRADYTCEHPWRFPLPYTLDYYAKAVWKRSMDGRAIKNLFFDDDTVLAKLMAKLTLSDNKIIYNKIYR